MLQYAPSYFYILTLLFSGGDGPKLIELLQMREKHRLQDRIILLGPVKHTDVRNVSEFIITFALTF